jgi:transposase-like protein
VLGIYESNSESSEACNSLLSDLESRGMPSREILFVVDGGSGLNKALEERYRVHDPKTRTAVRVRCFFHKWINISKDLNEEVRAKAAGLYWGIRDASRLDIAINCAEALESLLHENNLSALKSFLEAKEDLLVIHRLRLSPGLKKFFSTTNAIESLNYLIEEDLRRVKHWQDSNHFQRWLATACIKNEKRMRRIHGFQNLPALKAALSDLCFAKREEEFLDKVAVNG